MLPKRKIMVVIKCADQITYCIIGQLLKINDYKRSVSFILLNYLHMEIFTIN